MSGNLEICQGKIVFWKMLGKTDLCQGKINFPGVQAKNLQILGYQVPFLSFFPMKIYLLLCYSRKFGHQLRNKILPTDGSEILFHLRTIPLPYLSQSVCKRRGLPPYKKNPTLPTGRYFCHLVAQKHFFRVALFKFRDATFKDRHQWWERELQWSI